MKTFVLNNGVEMPALGYGVFKLDTQESCLAGVSAAIRAGYRLIDTAAMYRNEAWVGQAVRQSGLPREEFFITTKLWLHQMSYEGAKVGFERSLERLGLEYIDLFLLHWPYGDAAGAWRALEELYRQGRVRAIGVCNFTRPYLDKLLQTAEILPAVDQMECHPLLQLPELRRYLAQKGIQPEAWSPVGRMHPELTGSPVLGALAQKHGKSLAQIILRWHLQEGIVAIPKAAGEEKIRQNIDILDFELSEEEMAAIRAMDRSFHTNDDPDDPTSEGRLASRPTGF